MIKITFPVPSCVKAKKGVLVFQSWSSAQEEDVLTAIEGMGLSESVRDLTANLYLMVNRRWVSLFHPSIGETSDEIILTWGREKTYIIELHIPKESENYHWTVCDHKNNTTALFESSYFPVSPFEELTRM